jgi:hypothetical protein
VPKPVRQHARGPVCVRREIRSLRDVRSQPRFTSEVATDDRRKFVFQPAVVSVRPFGHKRVAVVIVRAGKLIMVVAIEISFAVVPYRCEILNRRRKQPKK